MCSPKCFTSLTHTLSRSHSCVRATNTHVCRGCARTCKQAAVNMCMYTCIHDRYSMHPQPRKNKHTRQTHCAVVVIDVDLPSANVSVIFYPLPQVRAMLILDDGTNCKVTGEQHGWEVSGKFMGWSAGCGMHKVEGGEKRSSCGGQLGSFAKWGGGLREWVVYQRRGALVERKWGRDVPCNSYPLPCCCCRC